jgi:hypothetical protein
MDEKRRKYYIYIVYLLTIKSTRYITREKYFVDQLLFTLGAQPVPAIQYFRMQWPARALIQFATVPRPSLSNKLRVPPEVHG